MPTSALIFDLDGTLVDSHRDIAQALNQTLDQLGYPQLTDAQVRNAIGGGVHTLLERATGSSDPDLIARGRALFGPAYNACLLATTAPYSGIVAMLDALRCAQVGIALATNKPRAFTAPIVRALKLEALGIQGWASADEVPEKKPDPAVVQLAMDRAGLGHIHPKDTVYVGDMAVDMHTARAFGARGVGVAWGFDPEGCQQAQPDIWVDHPSQITERFAHKKS